MLSLTGRYALRILGHLVENSRGRIQGREIARATGIPANYLSKLLNQMRKRGLVHGQKGWGGGFLLKEKALSVPIAEVLDLFEGPGDADDRCVFELRRCDAENPCPMHGHWERVRGEYRNMLRSLTVGDLRAIKPGR